VVPCLLPYLKVKDPQLKTVFSTKESIAQVLVDAVPMRQHALRVKDYESHLKNIVSQRLNRRDQRLPVEPIPTVYRLIQQSEID
jgi:hypothetical protein